MLPDLDIWLNHFEYHAQSRRTPPEDLADDLTDDERRLIARSIATFQLGEQSEGRSLLRAARRFAERRGTPDLVRITELFIREEQHHAALLGEFMDRHGIPRKQREWTDRAFRRLRKLAGYELCVTVLVTAELIGYVYYRALEVATKCKRLRVLCRMLVADELAHIGFESDVLLAMRASKPPFSRVVTELAHRTLLISTAVVVWFSHRAVLRRAGYRMSTFLAACDAQYRFYFGQAAPKLASDP